MVRLIEELVPWIELCIISPNQSEQVEPPELDREEQLQQRRKEERRQRNAHQCDRRDRIVRAGILLRCGQHAERHRNQQRDHKRNAAHDDRQADDLVELRHRRHVPLPAIAEVAHNGLRQPRKEARHDVQVETIGGIQLLQPFLIGLCAWGLRELNGHGLRKRAWQTADQGVDDEHHTEQDQNRLQDSLDDIISHFLIRSFLARPEPR